MTDEVADRIRAKVKVNTDKLTALAAAGVCRQIRLN